MTSITFYVIRSKVDNPGEGRGYGRRDNPYAYKKGWYASREFVKEFKDAKFFPTIGKASTYLKNSHTLGCPKNLTREDCFEIVPVEIREPE